MKKRIVLRTRGDYAPSVIKAMQRGGYRLAVIEPLDIFVHMEFKPRKK